MSAASFVAESRVPTDAPQRVMTRLCKHFAHKTPVELADDRGRIEFRSGGFATLRVAPDTLEIRVTAADADTLTALLGVVERHLKMVEFRDAMPVIDWARVPDPDAG